MQTAIVWFRQDLRLADNPALHAAIKNNHAIIPFYCYTNEESGDWQPGAASRWWLHFSLISLRNDIKACGSRLIVRKGSSINALVDLVNQTGATSIYYNSLYEPDYIARDQKLCDSLTSLNIDIKSFHGNLLCPPSHVQNQSGKPYRVFTPFYRYYIKKGFDTRVTAAPKIISAVPHNIKSTDIDELSLLPAKHWHRKFENYWQPGKQGAQSILKQFIKKQLADYPNARDFPSSNGSTRLSPHLHFGEISPRQVIALLNKVTDSVEKPGAINGRDAVIRQLIWRDFANHILLHFPHTTNQPFLNSFKKFTWKRSAKIFFTAWKQGNTGVPIVDAGMRQLWETGSMHNRVRMIVASLLVKNANLHWVHGARWFWDTLVDADLANNSMNWQWVAGCGVDAAPYFRIFNPINQGKKFDPDGAYIKQWIPELAHFPRRYIHDPWNAPIDIQQECGLTIGKEYPMPVIDIVESRRQALRNYNNFRQTSKP